MINNMALVTNTVKQRHFIWLTNRFFMSCSKQLWLLIAFESLTQHVAANRSFTLVLWFNLSLVLTCILRNLVHYVLKNAKLINITIFHVFVFHVSVIYRKLLLNFYHFIFDFELVFSLNNCFKLLSHIPWIFTF